MAAKKTRKRKTRRHGTPRSALSVDVLGNKGALRMKASIKSLAKTWTNVHFVVTYLQAAHIRTGGWNFLETHGVMLPDLAAPHLPGLNAAATNFVCQAHPSPVAFIPIPHGASPLPLGHRGRLETHFDTSFGTSCLEIIQDPQLQAAPLSDMDIIYQHVVLPRLNSALTNFPNLPVNGDAIDKIDISQFTNPTRNQNMRHLIRSQVPKLMAELKGYYTSNFGDALAKLVKLEIKALLLPNDQEKVLAERLLVYFAPLYVADVTSANPTGLYDFTLNHPLFHNDQGARLYNWNNLIVQECIDLLMPLFSLLAWSLDHQRLGRAIQAPPAPVLPLSQARFQIKRWGADWQTVIGDRDSLYESSAVIMTYMSSRHLALSVNDEDELPKEFSPIDMAPRKTRMKTEILSINYDIFQGIIVPDVQVRYHSLPGVYKRNLKMRDSNGVLRMPRGGGTESEAFKISYMARFTKRVNPTDGSASYFPNIKELKGSQDGHAFFYRKCKEDLPITKIIFASDGVKEFQVQFVYEPTDDQVARKPHLAVANRVATYEELEDHTYRNQDMPLTDEVFPDTQHTGWLTALKKTPHLPAAQFVDRPAPGACKIVGTDPGQTFLTQSVDRNMTRVRDEYDAEITRLSLAFANGLVTQAQREEGARLAKEEVKSHFRSISGNHYAEQTLTAWDERTVAAYRAKDAERWINIGSNEEVPSYDMRMDELKGAAFHVSGGLENFAGYLSVHADHWRTMSRFVNKTCKASSRHSDRRAAHFHFLEKATLYNSFNMSRRHFLEKGQSPFLRENRKKRKRRKQRKLRKLIDKGHALVYDHKDAPEATQVFWGEGSGSGASKGRRGTMQKEMARASAISAGCGVVLTPEYNTTRYCCTACGSVDFALPPQLPNGDPSERLSGLTPHRAAKVQGKVVACPVGHEIVYGRPHLYGLPPKSGNHKKRKCCVMANGDLVPTSQHQHEKWEEITRLMACTICASRNAPLTKVSNRFQILEEPNAAPPPPLFPPGPFAQYQEPPQGNQITRLTPRDFGSSNGIRNDGISNMRADGQRPAHNVHPASLAHVRQQEQASRAAGPWQNRAGGGNHLHKRKTD